MENFTSADRHVGCKSCSQLWHENRDLREQVKSLHKEVGRLRRLMKRVEQMAHLKALTTML
jgi:hypothetical protein